MARFYSNENFPLLAVVTLRDLGHDVLPRRRPGMQINGSLVKQYSLMPLLKTALS